MNIKTCPVAKHVQRKTARSTYKSNLSDVYPDVIMSYLDGVNFLP